MGRNKFSNHEIDIIAMLLRKKNAGTRFQQKEIRHQLRVNFEFNISDFNTQGKAFGEQELYDAINRGAIRILDDATIEAMKARRKEMLEKERLLALQEQTPEEQASDWQSALKEWQDWEASQQ